MLSTLPTLGDLDEGYFRNACCALYLIFTFLLVCTIIFCNELQQVRSLLKDWKTIISYGYILCLRDIKIVISFDKLHYLGFVKSSIIIFIKLHQCRKQTVLYSYQILISSRTNANSNKSVTISA